MEVLYHAAGHVFNSGTMDNVAPMEPHTPGEIAKDIDWLKGMPNSLHQFWGHIVRLFVTRG